jgi:hypothetical protein
MPPKAKDKQPAKGGGKGKGGKGKAPEPQGGKGWLMLAVGTTETASAPGKALHLAEALCPEVDLPTVDEVRAAYPEAVYVGQSGGTDESVSLRSLSPAESDDTDDDEPADEPTDEPAA